ncbi:hypothetical protein [Devosia faecipullorum]|uniref:hypothetical protein n=1 Tax=Devosia faecipullorum TaxID=2755039 RepID=UPI00187B4E71|nr:hypothetical protein [Devosia faecipullorum]MBE7732782.1 hypothetical protein [Devosia faecipullorum]
MTNPIGIGPAVMINRIAHNEGASLTTQLAKVAQLRLQLASAQAGKEESDQASEAALAHPANGAEIDLLI